MTRTGEILDQIKMLPALPPSATEVVRLVQDPKADFSDISSIIEYDPSLTSNVLKFANSALFGGTGKIKSVKDATIRLGTKNIFQMVVASAIAPFANEKVSGYDLDKGALWEHSVAVATAVKVLAKELEMKVPEYVFTAGLVHDIGKIALGNFVEIDSEKIMSEAFNEGISFESAERNILGLDHAEVGAVLLESWNIPNEIVDVVRWHHDPSGPDETNPIIDLIHAADVMCMTAGIGAGTDGLNYTLSKESLDRLGLKVSGMEVAICKTINILGQSADMFEINGRSD